MRKQLLLVLLALMPFLASAEIIEIDGLRYNIISKVKAAEVYRSSGTSYSGDIIIPSTVTYEGVDYKVSSIGNSAFNGCTGLTSITIPNGVTFIGNSAFNGCTSLTSITIPNGVTSICEGAFQNCTNLVSITIPNSLTAIKRKVFQGCTSLVSVTISNGVMNIRASAFEGCTSLTSITIPESVTQIGEFAFCECTSLTYVECKSITPPKADNDLFSDDTYKDAVLYVPLGTSLTYKSAPYWGNFGHIVGK